MPELPEVETIRRQLQKEVAGSKILSVGVRFAGRLNVPAEKFKRLVAGAKISSVGRRAKLLLIGLSNGWTLAVHLKMTGRFLLAPKRAEPSKHARLVFDLSGGRRLFFEDMRKFGYVKAVRTDRLEEDILAKENYGPEPLEPSFTFERFAACLAARGGKKIKPLLMDQTCIAGMGNIYADEACWRARVRPTRRADSLAPVELRALYRGAIQSLRQSIKYRGTSADMYLDLYGREGRFVPRLKVYGREGKKCGRCGGTVVKVRLGGRGAHYCPKCQR